MRIERICLVLALGVGVSFGSVSSVCAESTSDLILKLLVKKGVLSQSDVDDLKSEVKKTEAVDVEKHAKGASWAEKVKVKGDIRLRNEYERAGTGTYVNRQRIRARAGIKAKITDTVNGEIALGTGGIGNARSTNQTLTDAFGTKAFDLDMAYIDWTPHKVIKFTGGKYDNPLYHPGDLLWDSDLRFEGGSANIKYPMGEDLGIPADLYVNSGVFVLDDLAIDKKNPYLYAVQGGLGSSVKDVFDWKAFVGYLDFTRIKGHQGAELLPTTGRAARGGGYYYDYDVIEASGEITFHLLEQELPKPFDQPFKIFGDYVTNAAAGGDKKNAFQAGVQYGKKVKEKGDWKTVYNFRAFEANAFPDDFPDADAFRGGTNGYGHEVIFQYGLAKNVNVEVDYYAFRDKPRAYPNEKWGHLIQTDINVKF
ncbi:MAG: putative porin [Candidatus Omnitrophota bacterium]